MLTFWDLPVLPLRARRRRTLIALRRRLLLLLTRLPHLQRRLERLPHRPPRALPAVLPVVSQRESLFRRSRLGFSLPLFLLRFRFRVFRILCVLLNPFIRYGDLQRDDGAFCVERAGLEDFLTWFCLPVGVCGVLFYGAADDLSKGVSDVEQSERGSTSTLKGVGTNKACSML